MLKYLRISIEHMFKVDRIQIDCLLNHSCTQVPSSQTDKDKAGSDHKN